jgi:hypothetical protein
MKKLSEQQLIDNVLKFMGYIGKYISKERAEKLIDFYTQIELSLATAPASPKASFHNCFPGGYVDHVIRVVEAALVLDKVWDRFNQVKNYTTEELVFSAINHDLGKLGLDATEPFYIPNDSQWHIDKQGAHYKINPKLTHMRISDRSLYYLQLHGISVTENEFLAIKLHDGLYEEANKPYYITFSPDTEIRSNLPYILHQADLMASRVETQINK